MHLLILLAASSLCRAQEIAAPRASFPIRLAPTSASPILSAPLAPTAIPFETPAFLSGAHLPAAPAALNAAPLAAAAVPVPAVEFAPAAAGGIKAASQSAAPIPGEARAEQGVPSEGPLPTAESAALPEEFWDGSDYSHLIRARPYWHAAFVENADLLSGQGRWKDVPGFVSASHFSTRDQFNSPVPGILVHVNATADPAQVYGRMVGIDRRLAGYRLLKAAFPGPSQAFFLARPVRKGDSDSADPQESAASALNEVSEILPIGDGWQGREAALRRRGIETPRAFPDRASVLRYIVLGEHPAGGSPEKSRIGFLAAAIRGTAVGKLWTVVWERNGGLGRRLDVVLSAAAPADAAPPTSVQGAEAKVQAYGLAVSAPSAAQARRNKTRETLRWARGWAGLALTGTLALGAAPAFAALIYHIVQSDPTVLVFAVLPFGLPIAATMIAEVWLLKAAGDAIAWVWRMARLYFAVAPR
jgi:hypothetical protein